MAQVDKDISVVKGKIFTPKHNFYGIFVAFLDNYTATVSGVSLVFSIYSETHDISLADSWDKFEKKIQDMIYGGNSSKSITNSTQDKLKADSSIPSFGSELKDSISKNRKDLVTKLFHHTFSKDLNDENIEIECAFENISAQELQEGRVRESSASKDDSAESQLDTPPDYRLVKAKLILAPVDGKIITDLREGDAILLNLITTGMTENGLIDKMKLRKPDGSARPAPGKIVKIQNTGKGWQLLVHLTENYYAKILEEEKILVKTFQGPLPGKSVPARPGSSSAATRPVAATQPREKSGISWVAIGVVVLLGMAITYFAFLGG